MKFNVTSQPDSLAIKVLFTQTFTNSEGEQEGKLVGQLAHDIVTTASKETASQNAPTQENLMVYTAQNDDNDLLGAIVFTPLTFESEPSTSAYLLSPVAVRTENQGQGVGKALIEFALGDLKQKGVDFVVTYGDPAFYGKVGFKPVSVGQIPSPQPLSMPQGWIAVTLNAAELPTLSGRVGCTPALDNPEFW